MPRLVHFEMNVKDVHKAISFYEDLFGWKFQKWDGPMDYWLIMTGDENEPGIDGGLGYAEEGFPKMVNTINVDDIDAIIKKIEAKGGEIVRPKHAVPYFIPSLFFFFLTSFLLKIFPEPDFGISSTNSTSRIFLYAEILSATHSIISCSDTFPLNSGFRMMKAFGISPISNSIDGLPITAASKT